MSKPSPERYSSPSPAFQPHKSGHPKPDCDKRSKADGILGLLTCPLASQAPGSHWKPHGGDGGLPRHPGGHAHSGSAISCWRSVVCLSASPHIPCVTTAAPMLVRLAVARAAMDGVFVQSLQLPLRPNTSPRTFSHDAIDGWPCREQCLGSLDKCDHVQYYICLQLKGVSPSVQIPADNLAYSIMQKLIPGFVKIHLPVHRILYLSGEAHCCCCLWGLTRASGMRNTLVWCTLRVRGVRAVDGAGIPEGSPERLVGLCAGVCACASSQWAVPSYRAGCRCRRGGGRVRGEGGDGAAA